MKKIVISTVLAIFLTGCTQTNVNIDENDKNNDINKNGITTENTNDVNNEKDNQQDNKDDNNKNNIENNDNKDKNEENNNKDNIEENIVYIEKVYFKSDDDIEGLKVKAKDKTIHVYANNEDNVLLLIQTNTTIKDIRIHILGEEFYNENFDIDKYLEKHYDLNYNNLDNLVLDNETALLLRLQEPETIPMYCISWINEKSEKKHYLVSYGFDENLNEIQRETIEIR